MYKTSKVGKGVSRMEGRALPSSTGGFPEASKEPIESATTAEEEPVHPSDKTGLGFEESSESSAASSTSTSLQPQKQNVNTSLLATESAAKRRNAEVDMPKSTNYAMLLK